jgi:eukaryotic-like serine/threonine-protein kinase
MMRSMTTNGAPEQEPTRPVTSYGLRPPVPAQREQPPVPPREQEPAETAASSADPRSADVSADVSAAGPSAAVGPADPGAGRLVGGRYRLLERLGFGGMGTVWRAHDEVVDRDVAVKEARVPDHLGAAERATAYLRMQREARAAARIEHPAVVTVHDVVTEDERPWIVMELIRGRSLAEVLEEGTLPPREAARIGLAVLGALVAAHEAGVLHRDVKPANVLLGRYDRVVLTDFGIAQVEGEQKLTETGAFIGSPEYLSPERVLGQRPGPESDLWSLGVVLYQAVEGVSPFRRQGTPATFQAVLLAELPAPGRAGPLAAPITGLLRKEPAVRLTAAQLADALRAVSAPGPERPPAATRPLTDAVRAAVGGAPPHAGSAPPARGGVPRGRSKVLIGAGAAGLAAVLGTVYAVVDPFGGAGGLPGGWKAYDEKALGVRLAVPGDYVRSIGDKAVTYTDPRKVFTVTLVKKEGVKDSAAGVGATGLEWYRDGGEVDYSDTVEEAEGRVTEATQQGTDAAMLDVRYVDRTDDARPRLRDLVLVVVSSKGDEYTLKVRMPAAAVQASQGRRIFDDVKKHLVIGAL